MAGRIRRCRDRSKRSSTAQALAAQPRAWRAAPRRGAKVWAVVKANAYGHGIGAFTPACSGADGFALLDLAEARALRALGWRGPILLLEGCFEPRDLETCSRLDLWHTVHHEAQIDWLAAHKTALPHKVFLKLNSGMNRLGFAPAAYRAAWLRLDALPQVDEITLMTHLATPTPRDAAISSSSLAAFAARHRRAAGRALDLQQRRHLAHRPATRPCGDDWVRPGILLYGSSPDYPAAPTPPTGACSRR